VQGFVKQVSRAAGEHLPEADGVHERNRCAHGQELEEELFDIHIDILAQKIIGRRVL